jgi:ketosteroid isomerase-like protein
MITMVGSSLAQDATPAPETDCPTTTAEDNLGIVQSYFDAVMAGDVETADSLLHEDFQHDLSTDMIEVPNEAGNADEFERIDVAAEANAQIVNMIAQDDWVAIEMTFDLSGSHLEVEGVDVSAVGQVDVMVFVRIECGTIAEAHFATDVLRALLQQGFEVVPPGE